MKSILLSGLCCLAVTAVPTSVSAQMVKKSDYALLSDKYGDPGYVGLMLGYGQRSIDDPLDTFQARAMSGPEIATLFQRLCLDKPFDREAFSAASQSAAPDFRPTVRELTDFSAPKPLLGSYNVAATTLSQNVSDYGITGLWLGEEAEKLEKRPYVRFSGGLIMTGPFERKDVYAPQCNLTLKVSGLASAKALLDTVQAALPGYAGAKRVEKPKYGYAIWTGPRIDGRVPRVTATANKLNKPEQTVHLTIQLLPAGMAK